MSDIAPRILTIGKATQDVFLKSDEFDPHIEGKVAYTHLPLGAKLDVEDAYFMTGGNATNVAVTLARQGIDTSYMWGLGDDPASHATLHDLDYDHVDTSLVAHSGTYLAGYSVILLADSGERTILNYCGKPPHEHDNGLQLDQIEGFDWVYPTALGSMALLEAVVSQAAQHKVKVMLNPSSAELRDPAKLKGLLEDVEVLCLNKQEMMQLVEGETIEELVRHGLHYCPVVIVSDGPNGACASDGVTMVTAGMYEDVPVVDRTGAGDAFAAGFLSQWVLGAGLRRAMLFASANSTAVVKVIGAKPGILHHTAELHDMDITEKPL